MTAKFDSPDEKPTKSKKYLVLGLKKREVRKARPTGMPPTLKKEIAAGSVEEAVEIFEKENSYYNAMTVNGKEFKRKKGLGDAHN